MYEKFLWCVIVAGIVAGVLGCYYLVQQRH